MFRELAMGINSIGFCMSRGRATKHQSLKGGMIRWKSEYEYQDKSSILMRCRVMDLLEVKNFIPTEFVETETKWFYNELGIDDMYFQTETPEA
jgi:hypothetical protein